MRLKAVYIDTNIFLHYKSFDEIDWLSIIDVDYIEIRVPSVVISELDKHKYNQSAKLRNKAVKVIKKLHKLADSGLKVNLKPNINITFEIDDDIHNFKFFNLDPNSQDDRLLGSILSYSNAHPKISVILITADLGIRLKAKFHQIEAINLPDTFKLPDELDPSERRIRELERELQESKRITPDLKICFSDDSKNLQLELKEGMPSDFNVSQAVGRGIKDIKDKFPKLPEPKSLSQTSERPNMFTVVYQGSDNPEILPYEISDYNKCLDSFYENYEQYLEKHINWRDLISRTYFLEIFIFNDGTCPAEDIDIDLHFPDGFILSKLSKFPKKPEEPKPPSQPVPRTSKDRILTISTIPSFAPSISLPLNLKDRTPPNVSPSEIHRTNSYDVNIHVGKLKQSTRESFDPMVITFESSDLVSPFHIDYKINAANVPKPVIGKLHVIFSPKSDK